MTTTEILDDQVGIFSNDRERLQCPKCVEDQCLECIEARSRAIKLPAPFLRGDEVHRSGTTIRWDWRDPQHRKEGILISCFLCGHSGFVRKQCILARWKGKPRWRGLCSPCAKLPLRRTYKGKYENRFGAVIDFDKSPHDHNRAWVYCPNYSTCGGLEQRRVDKYNIDAQPFYCSNCLSATRSSNLKKGWQLLKAGSEQKNGGKEKRQQEREDAKLLKAVNVVARNWKDLRNINRTHEQKLELITKVEFARGLNSKSQDEKNLENVANNYLTRLHVNKIFPGAQSWFRRFVETVVEQIEEKKTAEEIVSYLKTCLT